MPRSALGWPVTGLWPLAEASLNWSGIESHGSASRRAAVVYLSLSSRCTKLSPASLRRGLGQAVRVIGREGGAAALGEGGGSLRGREGPAGGLFILPYLMMSRMCLPSRVSYSSSALAMVSSVSRCCDQELLGALVGVVARACALRGRSPARWPRCNRGRGRCRGRGRRSPRARRTRPCPASRSCPIRRPSCGRCRVACWMSPRGAAGNVAEDDFLGHAAAHDRRRGCRAVRSCACVYLSSSGSDMVEPSDGPRGMMVTLCSGSVCSSSTLSSAWPAS